MLFQIYKCGLFNFQYFGPARLFGGRSREKAVGLSVASPCNAKKRSYGLSASIPNAVLS